MTGDNWKKITPLCKDFIMCMLEKDPKERITIERALVHPWFKKFCGYIKRVKREHLEELAEI